MNDDNEFELTTEEQEMLSSLRREREPGDLLEERVVRALRRDGHFGSARPSSRTLGKLTRIAAAVALFAGGVATGRYLIVPDAPQAAAATQPASVAREASQKRELPIPASGEMIVAETELWL